MNRRLATKKLDILDLLILFLVTINSGFALTNGYDKLLFLSGAVLLVLLVLFRTGIQHLRIRKTVVLLLAALVVAFAASLDIGAVFSYLQVAVTILSAAIIADVYREQDVNRIFLGMMRVIILVNIIVALLQLTTGFFTSVAPVIANGAGKRYYSWIIVNYDTIITGISGRPSGIFWEPGVFSAFIALTLVIDLMEHGREMNKRYLLVYGAAFLLCGSTAGFAYLAVAAALVMSVFSRKRRALLLSLLFLVLAVLFYVYYNKIVQTLVQWNPTVFRKLTYSNASLDSRLYSPLIDLVIMAGHPFGVGASNYLGVYQATAESMRVMATSRTSTATFFGACYGVAFFLTYDYLWIRRFWKSRWMGTGLAKILAMILFLLVITANPLYYNMFLWIFLFSFRRDEPELGNAGFGEEQQIGAI